MKIRILIIVGVFAAIAFSARPSTNSFSGATTLTPDSPEEIVVSFFAKQELADYSTNQYVQALKNADGTFNLPAIRDFLVARGKLTPEQAAQFDQLYATAEANGWLSNKRATPKAISAYLQLKTGRTKPASSTIFPGNSTVSQ